MRSMAQGGWGTHSAFYAEDRFGPGPTPLFVHGITCRGTEALMQVGQCLGTASIEGHWYAWAQCGSCE